MISADSNIFIHAANNNSSLCSRASEFLRSHENDEEFVLCEFVLIEIYMQIRNPAIFEYPFTHREARDYCETLRDNEAWHLVDYHPCIRSELWQWAAETQAGFRRIIDARLALTLRHHGVTEFATANPKDFKEFGFKSLYNPLLPSFNT